MKILFNKNFKAIRTGEFVTANAETEEFVGNTEDGSFAEMTLATLQEIAKANKVEFSKRTTKAELIEALETGIAALKLPTQNEKPDSLKVAEIVNEYIKAGNDDEEEILMAIVNAGVKFKNAGKLYKQAMIDGGHLVSSKDRWTASREIMVSAEFSPETWDEVQSMIDRLVKEVPATETSQAYAQIRKYAKEFEVDIPKPEKKVSAGGFRNKIYDFMIQKPLATKEDFFKWIVEKQDKEEKLAEKYWPIFELAKKVAQATIDANS